MGGACLGRSSMLCAKVTSCVECPCRRRQNREDQQASLQAWSALAQLPLQQWWHNGRKSQGASAHSNWMDGARTYPLCKRTMQLLNMESWANCSESSEPLKHTACGFCSRAGGATSSVTLAIFSWERTFCQRTPKRLTGRG